MERLKAKRRPFNYISQRDADIACLVLNGATLAETGITYGIGRERVRQIVCKVINRSCRPFVQEHGHSIGVFRASRHFLLRFIMAAAQEWSAVPK